MSPHGARTHTNAHILYTRASLWFLDSMQLNPGAERGEKGDSRVGFPFIHVLHKRANTYKTITYDEPLRPGQSLIFAAQDVKMK